MIGLDRLREEVQGCRACELYKGTTQAVFGEGPGEVRGDVRRRAARRPRGPRGTPVRRARPGGSSTRRWPRPGIDRKLVYVTNTVKHFHYEQRGKRRIHQRPRAEHINACRQWLDAELAVVKPRVLVCLGAVPAQALVGRQVKVTKDRGKPLESELAPVVMVTVHPSSILRERDEARRQEAYRALRRRPRGRGRGARRWVVPGT